MGTLRGAASIIGIGELPPTRKKPGRTGMGLAVEVAKQCIEDSGLRKDEVDGLITEIPFGNPTEFAEYFGIRPSWLHSVNVMGASGAMTVALAAAAVNAGLANNVLCLVTSGELGGFGGGGAGAIGGHFKQWSAPYGQGPGANYEYALIAMRYQSLFGLTDQQRVSIAVQQRENAQKNPNAVFYGTPADTDDILNSRMIADPLRILECVMPCIGGAALMVSRPEAADYSPNNPVYVLGAGEASDRGVPGLAYAERMEVSPATVSARNAFKMAELRPQDMDGAFIYDCYTIAVICEFEDAGFAPKGEGGVWISENDVTYKGNLPINTHGGQLSAGQPGTAGGMSHVMEAVRQLMQRGDERQIKDMEYAFVNNNGGGLSVESSLVLGVGVD